MRLIPLLALLIHFRTVCIADVPSIPDQPIGIKGELLFSDDFTKSDYGEAWHKVVPTFTFLNGELKGTQTRFDKPAEGKTPAIKAHGAVIGNNIPTKDSVIACDFKFGGATRMSVEFDDRAYKGSHYGHLCRLIITPTKVTLLDERDGSMRLDIRDMNNDPSKKAERNKLLEGRSSHFPVKLIADEWHHLVLETVGDEMRAVINDKPVAYLKSSGIAHPTKSKIELGVGGADGYFDNIKVWQAKPLN